MNARNVWWGLGAVVALAGLDLLGSYLAKEFSMRPRWVLMALGVLAFGLLFVVYARSLRLNELWIVTFGWVVILEVGVLFLDRFRFSTAIPPHKLLIAGLIIVLQIGLLIPSRSSASKPNEGGGLTVRTDQGVSSSADPRGRPLPFAWAERPDPRGLAEHAPPAAQKVDVRGAAPVPR